MYIYLVLCVLFKFKTLMLNFAAEILKRPSGVT